MRTRSLAAAFLAATLLGTAAAVAPPPAARANAVATSDEISIHGWVTSAASISGGGRRLTLATVNGTFEVELTAATTVRGADGASLPAAAAGAGHRILVTGTVAADARLVARTATVAPPAPAAGDAPSRLRARIVAAIEASAATGGRRVLGVVGGSGEVEVEVPLTATLRAASGAAIEFAALHAGQVVIVAGQGASAAVRALHVDVQAGGRPARLNVEGRLRARAAAAGRETWIVGRTALTVAASTAASTSAAVGDNVVVDATLDASGALSAMRVAVTAVVEETIQLRGTVDALAETTVTVDGLSLEIGAGTIVTGQLAVGSDVDVTATLHGDGALRATAIDVLVDLSAEVQFEGTIQTIGLLSLTVAGVQVRIDPLTTVLVGLGAAVGLHAEVTGTQNSDGSVAATEIRVAADALGGDRIVTGTLRAVGGVPGDWTIQVRSISGPAVDVTFGVDAATAIDESGGAAEIGAEATVRLRPLGGGIWTATSVRVRHGAP